MKKIFFSKYRFQNLLVCFFLYLIVGPFFEHFRYGRIAMDVFLTAVLVLAVHSIYKRDKILWLSIILLCLALLFFWTDKLGFFKLSDKTLYLFICLYIFSIVYSFLQYIFSAKKVDTNLISATLCLYLLLGFLWGTIYALVEAYLPGSFAGDLITGTSSASDQLHYFYYFSYVTLTTLGYGDILPQTKGATALCQGEAILGQFFTAVLVARLVGIQVSQQFTNETK